MKTMKRRMCKKNKIKLAQVEDEKNEILVREWWIADFAARGISLSSDLKKSMKSNQKLLSFSDPL